MNVEDLKKMVKEILGKGHLMSLATKDGGGLWVADVVFVYDDDLNIYWRSNPETRHSKAILTNPEVAGSITISNKHKELNLGIQFSGKAEKIEELRFDLSTKHLLKGNYVTPQKSKDMLKDSSWYILKPAVVDIINEKLWGYEKQTLKL